MKPFCAIHFIKGEQTFPGQDAGIGPTWVGNHIARFLENPSASCQGLGQVICRRIARTIRQYFGGPLGVWEKTTSPSTTFTGVRVVNTSWEEVRIWIEEGKVAIDLDDCVKSYIRLDSDEVDILIQKLREAKEAL